MGSKPSPSPFLLLGMGLSVATCLVAGMGLGYWLGESIGASVLLTLVGLVLGVAGAVATVRNQMRRYM